MLRMKMLILAFLSVLLIGCGKDPVEPEKIPVLGTVSLTDSLFTYVIYGHNDECGLSAILGYSIQNSTFIEAGSDSEEVKIYLHNTKTITSLSSSYYSVYKECNLAGLMNKIVEYNWISDTTAYLLTASDTLTTIDSSVVDIWWWYNGSRQSFHRKF